MLKILKYILAVLGWIVSLLLTINLMTSIFGTETLFWQVIGVGVGFIFNLAEIACLKYWEINRKRKDKEVKAAIALFMCCSFFLLSVSASVGSLELAYERAVKSSEIYQLKTRQIALQDTVIAGLSQTANKQRDINHISRSQESLLAANQGLKNLNEMQGDLDRLSDYGAGLGNALYRVYSRLFGITTHSVALIFNLIVSFLIESLMLFFAGNDSIGHGHSLNYQNEYDTVEDENLEPEFAGTGRRTGQIFGFNVSEKSGGNTVRKKGKLLSGLRNFRTKKMPKILSTLTPFLGFLNVRKVKNRTENSENSDGKKRPSGRRTRQKKSVRADGEPDGFLLEIYEKNYKGKSDDFILYVWDNWGKIGNGNRSLRKVQRAVVPILPGRQKISHQYVDRVLQKNNRKQGGAR